MATFAQIVGAEAINVCTGVSLADAMAKDFAPGFMGARDAQGNPIPWQPVPDGTVSNATVTLDGQGNVLTAVNPAPVISAPIAAALTKAKFEALYAANNSDLPTTLQNWPMQ